MVYLNPTARDYVLEAAPQLKPYANQVDSLVTEYKQKASTFEMPKMPELPKMPALPKMPSFTSDNK